MQEGSGAIALCVRCSWYVPKRVPASSRYVPSSCSRKGLPGNMQQYRVDSLALHVL